MVDERGKGSTRRMGGIGKFLRDFLIRKVNEWNGSCAGHKKRAPVLPF